MEVNMDDIEIKPNVENLNLMIEAIKKEPKAIRMGNFVEKNNTCGTTACLAGWANLLRLNAVGKYVTPGKYSDDNAAAEWMGITPERANQLFYTFSADHLPQDQRKAVAIRVLENIRDGKGGTFEDWKLAFEETGFNPYAY
jgi:hypothetical protein